MPLEPIDTFWLGYLIIYLCVPIFDKEFIVENYGKDTYLIGLAVCGLSGHVVAMGYRQALRTRSELGFRIQQISESRAIILSIGVTVLALIAFSYFKMADQVGGFSVMLSRSRLLISPDTPAYIYQLPLATPFAFLLIWCLALTSTLFRTARIVASLIFWLLMMGWFGYSGSSATMINLCVVLIIPLMYYAPKRVALGSATVVFAILSVAVVYVRSQRSHFVGFEVQSEAESVSEVIGSKIVSQGYETGTLTSGNFLNLADYYQVFPIIKHIPSDVSFDWGYMVLELATRPIPKAMWPDKRYPHGESWHEFYFTAGTGGTTSDAGHVTGPAPSFVGVWYYMYGYPGVLIGSFGVGWFMAVVRKTASQVSGISGVIVAASVLPIGFAEMNHSIFWLFYWLPWVGLPVFLLVILVRRPKRALRTFSRVPAGSVS